MEKLLITLLTLNLMGCGKQDELNKAKKPPFHKKTSTKIINDISDYDGDLIPNSNDQSPYLANLPQPKELISIFYNDEKVPIKMMIDNDRHMNDLIRTYKYGKNIHYEIPQHDFYIEVSNKASQHTIHFKNKHKLYQTHIRYYDKLKEKYLSLKELDIKEIHKQLLNEGNRIYFKFDKIISRDLNKDILTSLFQKSYPIYLQDSQSTELHYISNEKTIDEALLILRKSSLGFELSEDKKISSKSEWDMLTNQDFFWIAINTHFQTMKRNKKHPIIFKKIQKADARSKRKSHKSFHFHIKKRVAKITLKPGIYYLTLSSQIREILRKELKQPQIIRCHFTEISTAFKFDIKKERKLREKELTNRLSFQIGTRKLSLKDLNNLRIIKKTELSIHLRNDRNLLKGKYFYHLPAKSCRELKWIPIQLNGYLKLNVRYDFIAP